MLKNIVLLFNLFILLIYQALVSNTVSISQKSPESVKAGDEFTVEITISKGTISGFAKFQQDLPEGFTASNGEAKGGSFTFSDQKVKIIWMSLPPDAEFKVTYKVKVANNVSGDFTFNGNFSYLENNDKKSADMPAQKIKVTSSTSTPLASNAPSKPSNNNDEDEDEEDDEPVSNTPTTTASSNLASTAPPVAQNNNNKVSTDEDDDDEEEEEPAQPVIKTNNTSQNTASVSGSVKCTRSINTANLASNREIIVTVTINKGSIAGFAKLQETLPVGFTASNIESSQGVFSFVDQKAKFLWMTLPAEPTIKVSYKITVAPGITGVYYLNGEFSYVENDETKKAIIERQEINLSGTTAPLAQNNQANMSSSNNIQAAINQQATANNNQNNVQTSNAGRKAASKVESSNNITNIPAPQTGINYRVQIAAGHTPVSAGYFKATKGITDYVNVEDHEGWKKYTIGNFAQYRDARDKRESVKNNHGVNGPFVTAYNNGVRITVQEALMISNQRWVQ